MNEAQALTHYNEVLDYYSVDHDKIIRSLYLPEETFLDVGCGDGRAAEYVDPLRYIGLDYAAERIKKAKRKYPNHIFVDTSWQDATLFKFDFVYCAEVLEHLDDPFACVKKLKKHTARLLVATVPIDMPYKTHQTIFKTAYDALALGFDSVVNHINHFILTWEPK